MESSASKGEFSDVVFEIFFVPYFRDFFPMEMKSIDHLTQNLQLLLLGGIYIDRQNSTHCLLEFA